MSQAACTNVRLLNEESSVSVSEKKQSLPRIHLSQPRLHPVVSVGRWPLEANPVSQPPGPSTFPEGWDLGGLLHPEDGFHSRWVRQVLEKPGRLFREPRKRANEGPTHNALPHAFRLRAILPYTSTLLLIQEGTQTLFSSIPSLNTTQGARKIE